MSLELVNPHVTKILLAVQDGDSINSVSRKTGGSYGWTHNWIKQLEEIGVVERDDGIHVRDSEFRDAVVGAAKAVLTRDFELEDAYLLPNFSGMAYRFSRTDAVFVWTKGGYQIARNQRDYPIFIDVFEDDIDEWKRFFEEFSVEYTVEERRPEEEGIYFVLFPRVNFTSEWVEHAAVTPLDETVEWMQQYEANFQPALEMLDEMYDLELGVQYRERETL